MSAFLSRRPRGLRSMKSERKFRILVVEDNPDHAALIDKALKQGSEDEFEIEWADDGEKALLSVTRYRPDLMLLDLKLPKRSGLEVLQEIRSNVKWKKIPVVILTTTSHPDDIERAYELGANSFLSKPLSFAEWNEKIGLFKAYWFHTALLPWGAQASVKGSVK